MNVINYTYPRRGFSIVLLILSFIYLAFISIYSINQFDLGYQLSMVERIKSGQLIYKDFDYVRPFFSIVFWDYLLKLIPVNSHYLILIARILVIIESFIICHIIQKLLFEKAKIQLTFFFLICFLHSFPIMPWHTIDGILFSLLALLFYKNKWFLSAIAFSILAAFTKQSFFIFGFVIGLMSIWKLYKGKNIEKKDIYIFIPTILFLIISIFQYRIFENLDYFFKQVFNTSSSSQFYESSVAVYFSNKTTTTIAFILFLALIYFIKIGRKITEILLAIVFPLIIILPFFNQGVFLGIHSLFLILVILFWKYERENKFIFFILFLAWSSSISWGYNTPIFFILILLFKFIEKKSNLFVILWVTTLIGFFVYRIKFTYLTDSLLEVKHIVTNNTKSVSGLLISENDYFYILEAQQINKTYKNVIFLPGSPLLDLINFNFPNRASWEMDVEYPNWKSDFYKLKDNIIAVDNKQNYYKEGFYISSFTLESIKRKKIIKKTKYFTIYGN